MRIGVSGTHGTGKTTLVDGLCARLPAHEAAAEPYFLLEDEGYDFGFPPSADDYRALYARSLQLLRTPAARIVFDRTPVDYLAYLATQGADPGDVADPSALRSALASLDLLVLTPVTPETERLLPSAELPRLREKMNEALLELVFGDPLDVFDHVQVLELSGPLSGRLNAVLAALAALGMRGSG